MLKTHRTVSTQRSPLLDGDHVRGSFKLMIMFNSVMSALSSKRLGYVSDVGAAPMYSDPINNLIDPALT